MTPLEKQYQSIKDHHQDKILLFRLGDFYEIFNGDAEIAASVLNIALTKRNGSPMCGFPYHAFDQYAYRLVEAGHRLAICEQAEDPASAKGLVRREVVAVLTKGTWADNPLLDRSTNTFLCSFAHGEGWLSLAFADVGTGEVFLSSRPMESAAFLRDEIARYRPVEILAPSSFFKLFPILEEIKSRCDSLRLWETTPPQPLLDEYLALHGLDASATEYGALAALFAYLQENHLPALQISRLMAPRVSDPSEALLLGGDTLAHLELLYNNSDFSPRGSLFAAVNRTKSHGGSRLLRRLLAAPSARLEEIKAMQERTRVFLTMDGAALKPLLHGIGDLERLCARLAAGKILPRECLALADAVQRAESLKDYLASAEAFLPYRAVLRPCGGVVSLIEGTIHPEASNQFDGSVIGQGVSAELDRLKKIAEGGKHILLNLQAEERVKTGISTLKISYNKIYGYFIEVGKGSAAKVPSAYVRKQSLVNSERYTIPALEDFEKTVLGAEQAAAALEREIYEELLTQLLAERDKILPLAALVSEADLRFGLAQYAKEGRAVLPEMSEGFGWDIREGRHPVVELALKKESFIANDTLLDAKRRILIVTGPNMAGKSTYLRQNALFAVLAQIGAPVPAKSASMGVVDQIFTRIGAGDDLSSGRSTFFMEMEEAAQILAAATGKSLIIMDELGRGTSTSDGLAIAWAVIEHLLFHPAKRAKVFFSTHYHELTALGRFEGIANCSMAVRESGGRPVFLRRVIDGKASKSYGIHVAEMAGLDAGVVKRAEAILQAVERGEFFKNSSKIEQPSLFSQPDPASVKKNAIYEALGPVSPETTSPLEALRLLYELKNIQNEEK